MNKKIQDIIQRGPSYIIRKCIYRADSIYRRSRKKAYIRFHNCGNDCEKYGSAAFCSRIVSDDIFDPAFLQEIRHSYYYDEVLSLAEKCLDDRIPLFGKWTQIPCDNHQYPWNSDFISHHIFENKVYYQLEIKNGNYEIKVPWELGRMHQLPILAFAWRLSKNEKYIEKVKWIVKNFNDHTRVGYGVQWVCAMEAAIRIFNIIAAYSLIRCDLPEDDSFHIEIRRMAFEHANYLMNNLETTAHLHANNHYLADLLGIVTVASAFRFKNSEKMLSFARRELEREIERQITNDGITIEMSSAYTRLDAEILLYSAVMLNRSGCEISENYKRKLLRISEFLADISVGKEEAVQIGDNDSGRVLILSNRNILDFRYITEIISNYISENSRIGVDNPEQLLVLGIMNERRHSEKNESKRLYSEARIASIHKNKYELFFYNTNTYAYDMNGHKHNDNLSFILYVEGNPFFVDPGTGFYTSNQSIRNALRSNLAHNTFTIDKEELNDFIGIFGLINHVRNHTMTINGNTAAASHDGYLSRFGVICSREIQCENSHIIITDTIKRNNERAWKGSVEWNFTLHPDVEVNQDSDHTQVILKSGKTRICVKANIPLSIADALYSPGYLSTKKTKCIRAKSDSGIQVVFSITIL